eukprot:CAMPEP_0114254518 /NCGR_PEP_ID=MMETSP0058-20121206/17023_1 /TAXON_ID=36894 /ORGANISM="Pyramimonas parkeae, CCMP726" /LENGTH=355 /DNA_ID=CAMNT_0001368745 /DNA_START=261 /DNA_END=1325 /DNA_ORIENTATION=-
MFLCDGFGPVPSQPREDGAGEWGQPSPPSQTATALAVAMRDPQRRGAMGAASGNVTSLLRERELWATGRRRVVAARQEQPSAALLKQWVEVDWLRWWSAMYCPLRPAPRSTIAANFSADGKLLASTHGDHTVKLMCCRTGQSLCVLAGHARTPWAVRFNPRDATILASGSLDHKVMLWNTVTRQCVTSLDFGRPIASLAFHADGDILAVASGHRLYMWRYKEAGCEPTIALRTRRSLRAVHFHPLGAPLLLSAEVNDAEAAVDSPPGPALTRIEGGEGGGDGGARAWEIAFAAASAAASAAAQGGQPAPYRMGAGIPRGSSEPLWVTADEIYSAAAAVAGVGAVAARQNQPALVD